MKYKEGQEVLIKGTIKIGGESKRQRVSIKSTRDQEVLFIADNEIIVDAKEKVEIIEEQLRAVAYQPEQFEYEDYKVVDLTEAIEIVRGVL